MNRFVFLALRLSGFCFLARALTRQHLKVVLYHGVAPERGGLFNYRGKFIHPKEFERHMEFFKSQYTVLPLDEAVEKLQHGTLPPRSLCITFDDGYRNNFDHAFPILKKHDIPATVFLATDFVFRGTPLWVDRLEHALQHGSGSLHEKKGLDELMRADLKACSDAERMRRLHALEETTGSSLADVKDLRYSPLTEDMITKMAASEIRFGAHTESHPILRNVPLTQARSEITASRDIVRKNAGDVSQIFAYPNGQHDDWSPEIETVLAESGFKGALTTLPGSNTGGTPAFRLRRISMDGTDDWNTFLATESGVRGFIQNIRSRCAPVRPVLERVLVLGDGSRATLSIIRSLARKGIAVDLATGNPTTPAAASRYVSRLFTLPSERSNAEAYATAVRTIVLARRYSLLIPATESTVLPVRAARSTLEPYVRCALPTDESFAFAYDKLATAQLADELGIPTPASTRIDSPRDLDTFHATGFPLVVKPVSSRVREGQSYVGLSVVIVKDADELRRAVLDRLAHGPVIIQQHVDGIGVGQEFLAKDGEILLAFEHRRLREHTGSGASTLRMSAPIDADMLAMSRALLQRMRWTGVIMVEYRYDERAHTPVLIEMNGRFWGSLAVPEHAGVDFPYDLFNLLVHGTRPEQPPFKKAVVRDIAADLSLLARTEPLWRVVVEALSACMRLVTRREHWDIFALDDPYPAIALLKDGLTKAFSRIRPASQRPVAAVPPAQRVLFVCSGNINRSAFAEAYLRKKLSDTGTVEIRSAGVLDQAGRPSPTVAVETARTFDVSLASHRSQALTPELAAWADVIFCMDRSNEVALLAIAPTARGKTHLLSEVSDGRDISDPDQQSLEFFKETFSRIARAIDAYAEKY